MIVPIIKKDDKYIVYCADLIPTASNIHIPYIASYDVKPLKAFKEKSKILAKAKDKNLVLIFEHDINVEACTIQETTKGYRMKDKVKIIDL